MRWLLAWMKETCVHHWARVNLGWNLVDRTWWQHGWYSPRTVFHTSSSSEIKTPLPHLGCRPVYHLDPHIQLSLEILSLETILLLNLMVKEACTIAWTLLEPLWLNRHLTHQSKYSACNVVKERRRYKVLETWQITSAPCINLQERVFLRIALRSSMIGNTSIKSLDTRWLVKQMRGEWMKVLFKWKEAYLKGD